MELSWSHIVHLYHVFLENGGKENCAQFIEEEFNKMFCTKSLNDEHDRNIVGMNSRNIHDANDMHMFACLMNLFEDRSIKYAEAFSMQR